MTLTTGLTTGTTGRTTSSVKKELAWQDLANCANLDVNDFFTQDNKKIYDNAPYLIKVCNNCDVKKACLTYALHNNVQGWWGGTSDIQRIKMRRALRIQAREIVAE